LIFPVGQEAREIVGVLLERARGQGGDVVELFSGILSDQLVHLVAPAVRVAPQQGLIE
jgi:hypothetical protein